MYSKLTRLLSIWALKPASSSADFSGLRFALPGWLAVSDGVSVPVVAVELRPTTLTVPALKVMRPCVAPGCTPLAPYAVRTRNWLSHENCGKNCSSDSTHERLAFG